MPGHIASSTAVSKVADPIACSAQTASGPSEGKPAAGHERPSRCSWRDEAIQAV